MSSIRHPKEHKENVLKLIDMRYSDLQICEMTGFKYSYVNNISTKYWKTKKIGFHQIETNEEVLIAPKINSESIYFIYRQNGQEVRVDTKGVNILSSKKLTNKELNYINDNILNI